VYTGTHDNDTLAGWWDALVRGGASTEAERAFILAYLGAEPSAVPDALVRTALASVADTVLLPLPDVLGLGTSARMNQPGRADGNWRYRTTWAACTPGAAARLRALVARTARLPATAAAAGVARGEATQQRG
jgi:4-alpha-glucanotransferase